MNARKNPETPWLLVEIRKIRWDWGSEMPWVLGVCVVIMLSCSYARADGWTLYGDSLTAGANSWSNLLNRHELAYMQISAQGGRRLIDLEIPHDLVPNANTDKVMVFLSSNDAGQQIPIDQFREHLLGVLHDLAAFGDSVVCILPGRYNWFDTEPYRAVLAEECPRAWDIDIESKPTVDGLHFTPWAHVLVAWEILYKIQASGL